MQKQKKDKKNRFTTKMQKKLAILFICVLLAFVGLSVQLVLIGRDNKDAYQKKILSQQKYDSTTIPFKRGNIEDTNGTLLAVSEKMYNVVLDNRVLLDDEENVDPTVKALVTCFGLNESELRKDIEDNPDKQYQVWKKLLTFDEISGFKELQKDTVNNPKIKGVWFEEQYIRNYPNNSLACDVIGFSGSDNNGMYGLEEYYNNELNGTNGREYGYLNDDATLERTTVPAVDGNTLVTTIDANIQAIVEKYILQFNKEHENEAREGAGSVNTGCIVMNPNTGEILAMASYPTFDLNKPYDLTPFYSEEDIDGMDQDKKTENLNAIWKNFCINEPYEPGSTAKPMTVAMGLETGKIKGDETYFCEGALNVADHRIKCNLHRGHGELTVSGALEQSCNVALMYMSQAIGKQTFLKYMDTFNIGLRTNIDLAGEARTASLVFNDETMGDTELATSSFGQGYKATMIEMIAGFSSIINGGYYYEPHVVNRVVNANGATVKNIEPKMIKQTISESTSAQMREYLNAVVAEGTGKSARPAGYAIGGKTGTAETLPRGNHQYVVSFMGYAPADDPQVAIYVVIDKPNVEDQPHATYATGIVRNVLTEILPYMNIYMTEELTVAEQEEVNNWQITTPAMDNTNGEAEQGDDTGDGTKQDGTDAANTDDANKNTDGDNADKPADSGTANATMGEGVPGANEGPVYVVDPNTGELVDPVTGQPAEANDSAFDEENTGENIENTDQGQQTPALAQ